ncbi:hypothetical protein ABPG75_006890 [Micractinium tetrahymenae]
MSGAAEAVPELPRNIACAIALKARELEARERPAALLLLPPTRTLLALMRKPGPGGSRVAAVLARWTEDVHSGAEVQPDSAVQLEFSAAALQTQGLLAKVFTPGRIAGQYLSGLAYTALLNCAALEPLLNNQLDPAAAKAMLTRPDTCQLFQLTERHSHGGLLSALELLQCAASLF